MDSSKYRKTRCRFAWRFRRIEDWKLEIEIFLSALLITLLGVAYVKGYDLVKEKSPDHLPQFYLVMTTIRMLLLLTVVASYVLLTDSREDAIRFALIFFGMYVAMMIVTLSMRH